MAIAQTYLCVDASVARIREIIYIMILYDLMQTSQAIGIVSTSGA